MCATIPKILLKFVFQLKQLQSRVRSLNLIFTLIKTTLKDKKWYYLISQVLRFHVILNSYQYINFPLYCRLLSWNQKIPWNGLCKYEQKIPVLGNFGGGKIHNHGKSSDDEYDKLLFKEFLENLPWTKILQVKKLKKSKTLENEPRIYIISWTKDCGIISLSFIQYFGAKMASVFVSMPSLKKWMFIDETHSWLQKSEMIYDNEIFSDTKEVTRHAK